MMGGTPVEEYDARHTGETLPAPVGRIESKVYAGTLGTTAAAAVSAFTLWALGVLIWGASADSASATDAVAAVPGPVAGLVAILLPAIGSFVGGYIAKHTQRPDLP